MTTTVEEYFLIKPDWNTKISLKFKWSTGVQTSINKNEKRSALYTWPRRSYQYSISALSYAHSAWLKRKIYKSQEKIWGVPIWQNMCLLTAQASSGQKTLNVDESDYRNFEVGGEVILFSSENSYEIGTVESVASTEIVVTSNLVSSWPEYTEVYPILKGRTKKDQTVGYFNSKMLELLIEFEEEYDDYTRNAPDLSSFESFKGYYVLNTDPDWSNQIEIEFNHDYKHLGFFGATTSWTYQDETEFKFKKSFSKNTKSDIQKLIDFFNYHKGRWGTFWNISYVDDFVLTATFGSGDTLLSVEENSYFADMSDTMAGKWVAIMWPDNSYVIRPISSVSSTTIKLGRAPGKACSQSELSNMLICFAHICRFSQDELELSYVTDSFSDLELTMESVLTETPLATTTTTTTTTTISATSTTSSSSTTTNTQSTTTSTTSSTASSTTTNTQSSTTTSSTTTNTQSSTTISTSSSSSTTSSTVPIEPCTTFGPDVTSVAQTDSQEFYAGSAFDNDLSDANATGAWYAYWSGTYKPTGYVGQNFGVSPKAIVKYSFYAWNSATRTPDPKNWTLKASNTGAFAGEEVTLDTQTGQTFSAAAERKDYEISNNTSYQYYRFNITLNNGNATYVIIQEIEMFECAD